MSRLWIAVCVSLLGGCESDKVSVDGEAGSEDTCEPGNMPPFARITSHEDGDYVAEGSTESFVAFVGDPDDALSELTVNWYLDGALVCEDVPVASDGRVECDIEMTDDTSVIRVEVTDPDGYQDEDVVVVLDLDGGTPGNTPPLCDITAPPTGSAGDLGDTVLLEGLVSDAEDPASELSVRWVSDTLGELGSSVADDAGSVALSTTELTVGSHIIGLYVTDTAGASCVDWIAYNVLSDSETDNPPVVVITSPDDGDGIKAGETVDFEAIVSDIEDDEETLDIVWESDIDGVLSTDGASEDGTVGFSTDDLTPGEHAVTVTVTDSDGNVTTDTVVITVTENAGPTAPDVEIVPEPAYTNDDLFAVLTSFASDPDGDPISYTYTWTVDGVFYTSGSDTSIPSSATAKGQEWCVEVVASDGVETSGSATDCLVVQNTPPSIESVDISPDEPGSGEALSCAYTGFEDLDGDVDSSRYAWTVNGVYVGGGATLSDGFGSGDTITCTVTPNDGEDDGISRSDTITIENSAPVLHSLLLTPESAYTDDGMLCTPGSTTDADGTSSFAYTFRWEIDGLAVTGETGATLASDFHVKHNVVQCFATPYDGSESGSEVASNRVEIQNTPPTAPEIHVEPTAPEEEDDLICVIDVESTDLDGDSISYTFSWTVDGAGFAGSTSTTRPGDTVSSAHTAAGESWICTVTPFDGEDTGPSDSAGVTIEEQCPPIGGYGSDGALSVSGDQVLGLDVTRVTGDNAVGDSTLMVADSSAFLSGDELFVQTTRGSADDCLDGGAGEWQVVEIASISGPTLHLKDPLLYSVNTSDGSRHQVIRIPHFTTLSLAASSRLTAPAFNGLTGGVLIFRAKTVNLGIGAHLDMNERGFRGGSSTVGFAEHHGGRTAAEESGGGVGGAGCDSVTCMGSIGGVGDGGASGGSGGRQLSFSTGSTGGGGGGGAGQGAGGAGGVGATSGGQGGTIPFSYGSSGGGGGGGGGATSFSECADTDLERLLPGNGGQLGGSGGCADGGAGGGSLGGGCSDGAAGRAGGGVVVVLADTLLGGSGARISADGGDGGLGGDGADASSMSGGGGGGGADGGEGAHGGRVLIVADDWSTGSASIDAHADGGFGGSGGTGGAGSGLGGGWMSVTAPGSDGALGVSQTGGSGGGGQGGLDGADGEVHVWGSWFATPSFPYEPDPAFAMEFYGGVECFLEL